MPQPFLTARWESLAILNFACPRTLLEPLVPRGTTLDTWNGETLLSLVAFLFRDTRLLGIPIPFHRTFPEVNLRFYVRREVAGEPSRRAVVFIREVVPRWAISTVARAVYNEPYVTLPMSHEIRLDPQSGGHASYSWAKEPGIHRVTAEASGPAIELSPGSEAEFITEHYWGYTRQRDGGTLEYQVDHPRWKVWEQPAIRYSGPSERLYGDAFGPIVAGTPRSAFLAVGSAISVFRGRRI